MTTPQDLINLALKQANVLGVGQTASPDDTADAFKLLQMMLAQWQRRRYIVYHLVDYPLVATGATTYSVGTGGDFNIPRPSKIEAAFARLINNPAPVQPDIPLRILHAREDYNRITLKALKSIPDYVFYDSGFPMGTLYVWPVPTSQYEIHITVMETLQQFVTPTDTINLPPEYEEAIMFNMVLRLYPIYGLPPNPIIVASAKTSLNILEAANVQIPRLRMPGGLVRSRGYYINGDTS
jgi:hypothetical protein